MKRKKNILNFVFADISECNNWHAGTVCCDQMKFKCYDNKSDQSQNQRT